MKRKGMMRLTAGLLAAVLLFAGTGCDVVFLGTTKLIFDVSNAISGITGFILGSTVGSGPRCYMNGVEIDCNDLPENLQP